MNDLLIGFERIALSMVWLAVGLTALMTSAVVAERVALAWHEAWLQRVARRYEPLVRRALDGDESALSTLVRSPSRYRVSIARLLIMPLIYDRDPALIAASRGIVHAMSLVPTADRLLRSRWWWRRALAIRALGLTQIRDHTAKIVAALDDPNAEVRNAALDALADMQDPAALTAIVVHLHDARLHRGRRAAALAAFGSQCEEFLLDLARVDPLNRFSYARALAFCGTELSRPTLCEFTSDARVEVRAAAFEAFARVGLDDGAAPLVIAALDSPDVAVRAMAAAALHGWTGAGDGASRLARHLNDTWTVAMRAARSLQSMRAAGRVELEACARRSDQAGELARQMLWEAAVQS
jgi:HEAT repeat protein